MAKSNWKGTSGWGAIDDPTGKLTGRVLVCSAGVSAVNEDYLSEVVGTSDTFDKTNYSGQLEYAWPASTSAHPFANGTLGVIARAQTFSGDPALAQDCYIGEIDIGTSKVNIIRRVAGDDAVINTATLPAEASTRGQKHSLELRCYGTTSVTLQVLLDDTIIANVGDTAANRLTSGIPGIKCSSGTVYVDNFSILQYTEDGLAPKDWTPHQVTGITVAGWWKGDEGRTLGSGSNLSGWADQSVNSNDFAQASATNQPVVALTTVNGLPSIKFDGVDNFMAVPDDATLDLFTNGASLFIVQSPNSFTTTANEPMISKQSTYQLALDNTKGYEWTNGTATVEPAAFVGTTSVFQISAFVTDKGASTGLGGIWLDGTNQAAIAVNVGADNANELFVGKNSSLQYYDGAIAEIVLIHGECDTATRQKIEGYLAHKYATWPRLPATHPYRTIKPTI